MADAASTFTAAFASPCRRAAEKAEEAAAQAAQAAQAAKAAKRAEVMRQLSRRTKEEKRARAQAQAEAEARAQAHTRALAARGLLPHGTKRPRDESRPVPDYTS